MVNKNIFFVLGIFIFILFSLISFSNAQIIDSELEKFISDNSSDEISVIISFREKPLPSQVQDLVAERARIGHQYKIINSLSAKIPANTLEKISQKPFIEKIEPDYEVKLVLDESFYEIQANNLIEETNLTGRGIKVAVMDTGISTHNDLSIYQSIDFTGEGTDDLNGHGTHVAGIIASQNEVYSGISQGVELYNIKTLNKEGAGYGSDIIKGIEWAMDNNLDIISLSLGAQIEKCDGKDAISRAVDKASAEGLIVVVAAGNFGPEEKTITSPGCAKEAITVGSSDGEDIAFFSSRGPTYDGRTKPELVSPGVRITSTWINNQFKTLSGTSMSTPHVTGAIALLLEYNSSKDKEEILNSLYSSATNLGLNENTQGAGKLDVYSAYLILSKSSEEILEEEINESINDSEDSLEEEISKEEKKTKKSPPGLENKIERGKNPKGFGYGLSKSLEKLNLALTFNEDKKTELQLRFAERRLSESLSLVEEDEELSRELLEEYNFRMLEIEEELNKTKENGKNLTKIEEKIIQRMLIHQEVLEEVLEKVPEQAKPAIERAINNSKEGMENVLDSLEKFSSEKAAEMNLIVAERNLDRTREKNQANDSEEIDNFLIDSSERIKKAEDLTNNLTDEKKLEILERISNNTTKQKEILEETLEKVSEEKKPFVEESIKNIENEEKRLEDKLEKTNQKISEKQNTISPLTSSSNNPSQRARGITGRIIQWILGN